MYIAFFILLLVAFFAECAAMFALMSEEAQVPPGAYIGLALAIVLTGFLLGGVATEKLL